MSRSRTCVRFSLGGMYYYHFLVPVIRQNAALSLVIQFNQIEITIKNFSGYPKESLLSTYEI